MKKRNVVVVVALLLLRSLAAQEGSVREVDVCVYGGTSLGVIAAYTAKMHGKSVLLVEAGRHIGGLSSGGLGFTDIGNKFVVTGLGLDFYRRVGRHYGVLEQWVFEPSVAEKVFFDYLREADVEVWLDRRVTTVSKRGNRIGKITLEDSENPSRKTDRVVAAKVFVDCSYEGDLMARAGVSYTIGREDNGVYGETYNGFQLLGGHQFKVDVDPYVIPGDKNSGLLWGISENRREETGAGNRKVQAYNYRICLTDNPDNLVPIGRPENYDPSRYELLARINEKVLFTKLDDIFIWSPMPNSKTDINNRGAFSTDMIGASWDYPEADYGERKRIIKAHEDYTKGLLYFVGTDGRMPEVVRKRMREYGYPKDEYVNNGHWSPQLYVRESRRMLGEYVMTQHHCEGREVCGDGIAWAAYSMDSHNCDRIVVDGFVRNEGNVEKGGFPPYPISYRAITPRESEVNNLLVPFCLSASHIAYGSIRMEPVFMVLGQAAATAACLAIDETGGVVQKIDVVKLQRELRENPCADGRVADIIVDNDDEKNVEMVGEWGVGRRGFGPSHRYDTSKGAVKKLFRFKPEIKVAGVYDVYVYYARQQAPSSKVLLNVNTGGGMHEVVWDTTKIQIRGQTSGTWARVGSFDFETGKNGFIEITNKNADGSVVADAVLLVPNFK